MKTCWGKRLIFAKPFNNKGFTLVEMIFAFSFFLIIVAFVPLCLRMLLGNGFVEEELQMMEWEVFVNQVKKEIRPSEELTVENNQLQIRNDGQSIVYERWGTNIRRRVDLQGHEIILQNVTTVTFEPVFQGVNITIVDGFGQNYTARINMMIDGEDLYAP